ncbi:MAG TPA: hypothetical protein PKL88_00455 [bacterium]|nr:hypothetical protein [bacterium]
MADPPVVVLEAKEGSRYEESGECIATYNSYHIVFLPKGVQPGQNVRVKLQEIREDRRGNMMYTGSPADDEYIERWKDNSEGSASKVTIAVDWLLQESEVGVVETRNLGTKEEHYTTRTEREPVIGQTLKDSYVEEIKVEVYHTKTEVVRDGILVWEKIGEREELGGSDVFPATEVTAEGGNWDKFKTNITHNPSLTIKVRVSFNPNSNSMTWEYKDTTWGELPKWVQDIALQKYPVCSCGRWRIDPSEAEKHGGYPRCKECLKEAHCVKCGETTESFTYGYSKYFPYHIGGGQVICEECWPSFEQEQLIDKMLSQKHLDAIAQEAKGLISANVEPIESELAEMVLKAGLDSITFSWERSTRLEKEKGYRWYYFTPSGVFATKLEKSALEILQYLASATDNPLVEMVSWFSEGIKPSDYEKNSDYYLRTQVKGEKGVSPKVTESGLQKVIKKLEAGEPVLADLLRESEEGRIKLEEWLTKISSEEDCHNFDEYSEKKNEIMESVRTALNNFRGYKTALKKINSFEKWLLNQKEVEEVVEMTPMEYAFREAMRKAQKK